MKICGFTGGCLKLNSKSLVRPQLEYAVCAWHPLRKKDTISLENVQRRATRMVPELKGLNYEERLRALNLPSLSYRRARGDVIETYKMVTKLYDSETCPKLTMDNHRGTRGHQFKLKKQRSNTRIRQNYFTNRVISSWNSLTPNIVEAPNIKLFEKRLDKFWKFQDIKFNFEAQLQIDPRLFTTSRMCTSPISLNKADLDIQDSRPSPSTT